MHDLNNTVNDFSQKLLINHRFKEKIYLDKIKEIYKDQGSKKLFIDIIKKIFSIVYTTNSAIWFERDLTEEITDYQPDFSVEIDMNSIDKTIQWLKSQKQSWVVHPKEIVVALKYNHCWPYVSINGKIIGCIKIGFKNVFIVDYKKVIKFPEKMAFIYDTYVLEEQRGKGIGKYLILEAVKFLKSKRYEKVRCHIPSWNKISISAYEKIGFKKINYIRFYRVFGIKIRKISPIDKIPYD